MRRCSKVDVSAFAYLFVGGTPFGDRSLVK